ncbi:MAG: SMC-Scp complex subunit ScpB [candidate division Zixibacteria bacterium]|nr:SMC-Scp complex subunit ScpB [candidate division Zixibacteria bacterium]
MEDNFRHSVVEALILASPEPLPGRKISGLVEEMTPSKISRAVAELNDRYVQSGSSFRIRELAGGYQFHIVPEFTGYVQELFARRRKLRLTRAALEALAIVAYRQPATKVDIEHVRGVASDGVIHNLLEKNMITVTGRATTVGKPLQYGTTDEFLKFFGLNRLEDLPKMSEIEELISSIEAPAQPELNFEDVLVEDEIGGKLNVADDAISADETEAGDEAERQVEDEAADEAGEEPIIPEEEEPSGGNGNRASGVIIDMDTT